jgi:hypothetical protein
MVRHGRAEIFALPARFSASPRRPLLIRLLQLNSAPSTISGIAGASPYH